VTNQPIHAAASLIVMRDRASQAPEVLIIQRSAALAFAGGAYAFPGGRVDLEDRALAERCCPSLDLDDGAARIAAARETLEETAIAIGHPSVSADDAMLADGFAARISSGACTFDCDAFVPFARWLPHLGIKRRFDTRFFLAAAPAIDIDPIADGGETSATFWASAETILARCAARDGWALFPTRRLLERLARFTSFAEAREDALRLPQRVITPEIVSREDGYWLQIPNDAGYPITTEIMGETEVRMLAQIKGETEA
jgi:8-oxo-dGTP pyrophosphatase MutT (NUDIX family)